MTDVAPVPEPLDVDTSGLATTIAGTAEDTRSPLILREGTVTAVSPGIGAASVCSVSIGGAAATNNVRHICDPPEVGDTVWLLINGADRLILGVIGGGHVGDIKWLGGTTGAPPGWWPCDGRSTAGYPKLAARYGANIPDLRDRFVVGSGSSYAVGATGGAATVTLTTNQMPAHTHLDPAHDHPPGLHTHTPFSTAEFVATAGSGGSYSAAMGTDLGFRGQGTTGPPSSSGFTGAGAGGQTGSAGSGASVDTRPPYYALLPVIKFG